MKSISILIIAHGFEMLSIELQHCPIPSQTSLGKWFGCLKLSRENYVYDM